MLPEDTQLKTFIAEAIGHLMDCMSSRQDEEHILISLYTQFEQSHKEVPQLPDRFQNARIVEQPEEAKLEIQRQLDEAKEKAKALLESRRQNMDEISSKKLDKMVQQAYAQVKQD